MADLDDLLLALVGVLAQREGGVVEHVHRPEQRAVLEQDAELLAHLEQLVVGHVRHRLAVDEDVALVGVEQADHVLDAHRLAGARRAEDHRDLVVGDAEVEAVEDRVAAEGLLDVDELDGVGRAVVALEARVPLVGLLALARLVDDVGRDRRPRRPAGSASGHLRSGSSGRRSALGGRLLVCAEPCCRSRCWCPAARTAAGGSGACWRVLLLAGRQPSRGSCRWVARRRARAAAAPARRRLQRPPQGGSSRSSSASRPLLHTASSAYWRSWIRSPEDLRAHHPDQVDHDGVQHHRLRGRGAHAHRAAAAV